MSGPWHPTGRARVSSTNVEAHGICDFCGFRYLLKDLRPWQQWAGAKLQTYNYLVCPKDWDEPQQQLRSIIIPPDPVPVLNPRPEQYDATVPSYIALQNGTVLATQTDSAYITEIENTPLPDPNDPTSYPTS